MLPHQKIIQAIIKHLKLVVLHRYHYFSSSSLFTNVGPVLTIVRKKDHVPKCSCLKTGPSQMYSVGDRSLSSKVREGKARGILSVGVSDRTYYTLLGAGGESHTCSVWVYRQGHLYHTLALLTDPV